MESWAGKLKRDIILIKNCEASAQLLSPYLRPNKKIIASPATIFVTGGTGLVGTHLLRQLVSEGKKVRALYRTAFPAYLTNEEIEKIEWIKGDVLDADLLFHS